jgi:hypothetical protein
MEQDKTPRAPISSKPSIIPPSVFPRRPAIEGIEKANQRKIFLFAAAKGMDLEPSFLAGWISQRNPQEEMGPNGKKRMRVDLSFNFATRPFFVEERVGVNSLISETSLGTIKAYFAIRERIRKREIIAASDGFADRDKKYMDAMREFVPLRVRFEKDPNTPLLIFQRLNLSRFRVPVYEYNGNYFCDPRHAEAIALACRLWCGTHYVRSREAKKVLDEVAKYGDSSKLPYELGMKIWVLRAYSLEPGNGLHRLKTDLAYSRVIAEFFFYGQKDYLAISV